MKHISQREARRLRKRVYELETKQWKMFDAWVRDFPDGVHVAALGPIDPTVLASIKTSRMLGHAVVAVDYQNALHFYAVPNHHKVETL